MAERRFLAVDAGGTSTRAVLVDARAVVLGRGLAGGGNPTSRGPEDAAAAVGRAVAQALRSDDAATVERVLVAHAGERLPAYAEGVVAALGPLGVRAPVEQAGDLAALFAAGTAEAHGTALIAGTGAIGGAVRDGRVARVVDGTGWLLGDAGSGFWIGHRIARAVVDDLDGGERTGLTGAVLQRLQVDDDRAPVDGRPRVLRALVGRLYAMRPVELADLAPLDFALLDEDPLARRIVEDAVAALATLLLRVRAGEPDGPLVYGGSVLVRGILPRGGALTAPLRDAAAGARPVPVPDGLVGAAVLALRAGGVEVGSAAHARLTAQLRIDAGA